MTARSLARSHRAGNTSPEAVRIAVQVYGKVQDGMTRQLAGSLGMAESTIATLIKADFAKTKNLTYRFDQPEVRILAKMMVLRTVLGDKEGQKDDTDDPLLNEAAASDGF